MSQIELACKEAVFHFNKKHLEDPTVPMWIVMAKGETYYVEHVSANIPWTTKETPSNVRTKGAIKFKDCLVTIDDENCATISVLTLHDEIRIRNREKGITRVITQWGDKLREVLKKGSIKHGPVKAVGGSCSTTFYMTDILVPSHMTLLTIAMAPASVRILMPNEAYYKMYDDSKYADKDYIDEDEYYDDDELYEA